MTDIQRVDVHETDAGIGMLSVAPPAQRRNLTVRYEVGGRMYPWTSVAQCHTCQSHYRIEIEQALLRGLSYASVLRSLPADHGISHESLSNHVRRQHLPGDEALRRAMIEERATELGRDLDEHHGTLVDHITFARQGLQRTFERMAAGQVEPTISEAIALSRLLMDAEQQAGGDIDNQVYAQGFKIYVEVAQEVMSEEQFRLFGARLSAHPIMNALLGRRPIEAQATETASATG